MPIRQVFASHLPPGYPLASNQYAALFDPIFARAFQIHRTAHRKFAEGDRPGPREGILAPVEGDPHYCDCYEKAYQEICGILEQLVESGVATFPRPASVTRQATRRIRLEFLE